MLWVRSQDKMNLVKVNQISINYRDNKQIIANYQPELFENSGEYYEVLGNYSSKERAVEVLDDIQNFISINCSIKNVDYQETDLIMKSLIVKNMIRIYQMPEK